MTIGVTHNLTTLGSTSKTKLKFDGRNDQTLTVAHDFTADAPLTPTVFEGLFDELSQSNGDLTLFYDLDIVTSESFRLRNIQISCTTLIQIVTIEVPPTATVLQSDCQHTEQTG